MKTVRTKTSEMYFDEHGILHKTVIENCHIDLETLKESDRITREFTNDEKVLMLYDARNHFTITEDALQYSQKDIFSKQRIATAVVSKKTGIKITVDFMNNNMEMPAPIKIFANTDDAIKWLLTFKKSVERKTSLKN